MVFGAFQLALFINDEQICNKNGASDLARIRCKNGGRCRFDKYGVCVRCGFDYTYKRINLLFINAYSFVLSFIMILLGYDISLIFPNSFLSAMIKELLSINVMLGFIGMFCIFLILLLIISPLFLLPIRIARKRRVHYCKKVLLINLALGFTIVGWVVALVLSLRTPSEVVEGDI